MELPKDFGGLGVVVPGLVDGHLGCKYSPYRWFVGGFGPGRWSQERAFEDVAEPSHGWVLIPSGGPWFDMPSPRDRRSTCPLNGLFFEWIVWLTTDVS